MTKQIRKIRKQSEAQLEAQKVMQGIRGQVRQLCCAIGVPVMILPCYYCFALELYRLTRLEISGESLAMEADIHRVKWVARGLQTAVLEKIRTEVFSIPAPCP